MKAINSCQKFLKTNQKRNESGNDMACCAKILIYTFELFISVSFKYTASHCLL